MSLLIKSGAQESAPVRLLNRTREVSIPVDPRDVELAAVRSEIERMHEQVRATEAKHAAELETVRREAARVGRAEAERQDAERLEALREGLGAATTEFARRLDALDCLAAELTRAVIDKMFDGADEMADRAAAMLARRVSELRREAILAVRVSSADFPEARDVEALVRDCKLQGIEVQPDPALESGSCRICLRLGSVDLDIRDQWRTVSALLDSMAQGAS